MGIGKRSFARVTAKACCREKNKYKRQGSNYTSSKNNDIDNDDIIATILAIIIAIAVIGFCIFLISKFGIIGLAIIFWLSVIIFAFK